MAERRDNSALIALSELRQIEEDRIKHEEREETRKREEAERQRLEEEARRRAEEEARVRAEEDARKAEEERKRKEELEAHLRLQEAERRARIEAEAQLAAKRIEAEANAMAATKKPPIGLIAGIIGGLVIVAGGLGLYLYMGKVDAEKMAERRALAVRQLEADMKAANEKYEAEITKVQTDFKEKLALAKTEEDRQRLQAELDSRMNEARARRGKAQAAARTKAKEKGGKNFLKGLSDTDDPLGGLGKRR